MMKYAASVNSLMQFTNSHFEGAMQSLAINGQWNNFANCQFYNASNGVNQPATPGVALIDLNSFSNSIAGCRFNGLNYDGSPNDIYAINFNAAGNYITGIFQQFASRTPFNFQNDKGTNIIIGAGATPGNTTGATAFPYAPNEFGGTIVNYRQTGTPLIYVTSPHGVTGARPANANRGFLFYDVTLKKPIWADSTSGTGWYDATGTPV